MEIAARFRILGHLGAGALGVLHSARDAQLGRVVALREVTPAIAGDPAAREALLADARAARAFTHPHAVALLDIVEEGDRLLLVHEHVAGQPLSALLTGQPIDPRVAIRIAAHVAEALGAASAAGLVHGALDPPNVVIAEGDQAKILDIGLSRWTACGRARADIDRAIEAGSVLADPVLERAACYASPEQALGDRWDARSDVFSLGVLLYEMLTGHVPFASVSPAATAALILQSNPTPPSEVNAAVPAEADAVVKRALAKSLEARYQDASAMAADLRRIEAALRGRLTAADRRWVAGPAPQPRTVPPGPRLAARRWMPRPNRSVITAGVLTVAVAAAWTAWHLAGRPWPGRRAPASSAVVVVLPFEGGADNPRPHYGLGFAEDVAARLSEIPGTTVAGRASIRDRDIGSNWQAMARRLGASAAVRGSVLPGRYALHADVEILDVGTGARAWFRHFSREPRQISGLEVEIATEIARHFRLATPTSTRWARATVRQIDPLAYDLYLLGRDSAARRDRSTAIGLFEQALARDPRLVEARAGLSQALYLEEYYAGGGPQAASGRALREAEAALAVDAELPAAQVAAALAAPTTTLAASALARALAFDPSNGEAWHHAGDLVGEVDPSRSIAYYRRSLALEPTIDANWRDIASAFALTGKIEEAGTAIAEGEAGRPDRPWWRQMRARLDIQQERYDQAIELLLHEPSAESAPIAWLMGRVVPLALAGRLGEARAEASRLAERHPGFCEGDAVRAGLEIDTGTPDQGRARASALIAKAGRPDAVPGDQACAALAAAATGDSAEAAGWISRIAADERALRLWTRQAVFGIGLSFRMRWYPWNKVAASQPVAVASAQLDQSLVRLRDEVARRLPAPPQPPVSGK